VQCLHASLQLVVEPKVELIELRLEMIVADLAVYAASPVLRVKDVPIRRVKIQQ
jgi:hypothetical protein